MEFQADPSDPLQIGWGRREKDGPFRPFAIDFAIINFFKVRFVHYLFQSNGRHFNKPAVGGLM
jgi:hypothetical protein